MKIKILKNDNLGDLIIAIPFLHCLETFFPTTRIEVYVKTKNFFPIKDIFKLKSNFYVYPERTRLFQMFQEFYLDQCLIIDIVGNRFNSLLCKVNLNRSIGLNRYDLKSFYRHQYGNMKGIHESLNFLSFLPEILKYTNNRVFTKTKAILEKLNKILVHNKNILIDYSNYQTIYKPFFSAYKHQLSESDISWGKYFIYHAGGHKDKCFPYTSQINLISKLSELHLTAVIVGQDHESNRGRIIETEFKKHGCNVINMCGMTDDLFQLAELFKDTEFYVGPDSGTAHLSAALGTETIVYFGSTNSIRFSPAGSNVHIFTSSCKCSPCWEPQIPFSCKNYDCMEIINFPGLLDFFNKFKLDNA